MRSRRCRRGWRPSARAGCSRSAHIPMNLDYFLVHLPMAHLESAVLQARRPRHVRAASPARACCSRVRADWRRSQAWWLAGAAIAVLIPTLLYYGGGWLQYGYRYFLDSRAVRPRAVRPGGGVSRIGRPRLEGADRVRDGGDGVRRVLGVQPVSRVDRLRPVWVGLTIVLLVLAALEAVALFRVIDDQQAVGVDLEYFRFVAQRWLDTGVYYTDRPAAAARTRSQTLVDEPVSAARAVPVRAVPGPARPSCGGSSRSRHRLRRVVVPAGRLGVADPRPDRAVPQDARTRSSTATRTCGSRPSSPAASAGPGRRRSSRSSRRCCSSRSSASGRGRGGSPRSCSPSLSLPFLGPVAGLPDRDAQLVRQVLVLVREPAVLRPAARRLARLDAGAGTVPSPPGRSACCVRGGATVRAVDGDGRRDESRWLILGIFILSGAAGLVYEIVWSRQLVLVFGNTTQAVSAILTGFFGGMAIGAAVGGRVADRVRSPLRMYGDAGARAGRRRPRDAADLRAHPRGLPGHLPGPRGDAVARRWSRLVLAVLALAPATILMGATFPALTRHLTRLRARSSRSFGRLYAANTIGAIVGTLAAGLVLIELLGLSGALAVGAGCSLIAGRGRRWCLSRRRDRRRRRPRAASGAVATAAGAGRAPRRRRRARRSLERAPRARHRLPVRA